MVSRTECSVTMPLAAAWGTARPLAFEVGVDLADRYVLRSALGAGGSGVVFRAWDTALACAVAIKIFDEVGEGGPSSVTRLRREVCLARSVNHPNVCPVFDLARWRGHWFMTMELAVGTLRDEIEAAPSDEPGAEPNWPRRLRDARAVCAGLAAVHDVHITHADVTPRNILRMSDGRLALADFGLARRDGDPVTSKGGTLSYLAPEVMMGEAPNQRSDVWQLGVVLHEILLGHRPRWRLACERPVAELPGASLPAEVRAVLDFASSCLAWDPLARPARATTL
jgi:serine/threonine protein kinase